MKKPCVMTVGHIRPDWIRLSEIIRKFDTEFDHILVNSGQHYDDSLSGVFFRDLDIRKPDYNLEIGGPGKDHVQQHADLCVKLTRLCQDVKPDLIMMLGDSNGVLCAPVLRKSGFKIAHVESGMRSWFPIMLEETNRIVCDHVSDLLFVYHNDYKNNLINEGISPYSIRVVGNTIVEPVRRLAAPKLPEKPLHIALDIHRRENFTDFSRLERIISISARLGKKMGYPVKMIGFGQTIAAIKKANIPLDGIEIVPLMGFKDHVQFQVNSAVVISDSGTDSEQPALYGVPVLVPRDFTERPQAYIQGCATVMDVSDNLQPFSKDVVIDQCLAFLDRHNKFGGKTEWLGDGTTSQKILEEVKKFLGVA